MSKREAVLFEKENYVFDIYEGKGQSDEENILDAIEEAEREEIRIEKSQAEYLRELDEKWQKVVNEINERLRKFVTYLDGKDSRLVLSAKLENKPALLYAMMEKYSQTMAERIMGMADFISAKLLVLQDLQNQAKR